MVSAVPAEGQQPPLVRLVRNEATLLVEERLRTILGSVAADPVLDVGAATGALLHTAMELDVRNRQFQEYPALLCKLSRKWFPSGVLAAAHAFLAAERKDLDVGAGLQLHELAWAKGSEAAAVAWLMGAAVQNFVSDLCELLLANSLAAERRHAEVKRWTASKLAHIGTASRNAIRMRFLQWREAQCNILDARSKELRTAVRSNLQSLAWAQPGASAWRPGDSSRYQPTNGQPQAAASQPQLAIAGATYVRDHRAFLQAQKLEMMSRARANINAQLDSYIVPVTRQQWLAWVESNLEGFRARMVSAPERRRACSVRVRARPDLPAPAARLQPVRDLSRCTAAWAANLAYRTGWFGIQTRGQGVVMVFLILLRGQSYYVNLRNRAATGAPKCLLDDTFSLVRSVHALPHLEDLLADEEVLQVYEFQVKGAAATGARGGVLITADKCSKVTAPAPKPKQECDDVDEHDAVGSEDSSDCKLVVDTESEDEASSSDDTEDEIFAAKAKLIAMILQPQATQQPQAQQLQQPQAPGCRSCGAAVQIARQS